ncbi:Response regulator [Mycena kentingensis (nom. inval.)]|nr:Response regulator [Mycena kentingensis (nom. inval.)]
MNSTGDGFKDYLFSLLSSKASQPKPYQGPRDEQTEFILNEIEALLHHRRRSPAGPADSSNSERAHVKELNRVVSAVTAGDLTQRVQLNNAAITADAEFLELATNLDCMVGSLERFASEISQATQPDGACCVPLGPAKEALLGGIWKDLIDKTTATSTNNTNMTRATAAVLIAVARGDFSCSVDVDVRGELLDLKCIVNELVRKLGTYVREINYIAREAGAEGNLGGAAKVEGAEGLWKELAENIDVLKNALTLQVRATGKLCEAVVRGDLEHRLDYGAEGEMAECRDSMNFMIGHLGQRTRQDTLASSTFNDGTAMVLEKQK